MSTLLEESPPQTATAAAQRLRTAMAATRVSIRWLGVRRALSNEQRAEAAEPFGAEADYLSAAKKLLDTSNPAFKAVTANRIKRSKSTMTEPTVTEALAKANGQATTNGYARKPARRKTGQPDTVALIDQAEKVRTAARELFVHTGELVKALKQHRRQNRAVAHTLRQLKTLGV